MKTQNKSAISSLTAVLVTVLLMVLPDGLRAQLLLNDNATHTINFDSSIGWNNDYTTVSTGSVLHASSSLDVGDCSVGWPGSWTYINPGASETFSTAAWAYYNQNVQSTRTDFDAQIEGKFYQISFVNSVAHPELSSTALQFESGQWSSRDVTLRVQNNSGADMQNWSLAFDLWQFGNGGNNTTFSLLYSTDNTNYTPTGISVTLTNGPDSTTVISRGTQSATLSNVTVPAGGFIYLRFAYTNDGGGNGAIIDNIAVRGQGALVLTDTTTLLSSSENPSTNGDLVTFTAAVSPAPDDGTTISFYDNAILLGTGTTIAGTATFATDTLAPGIHPITAAFGGTATLNPSTSTTLNQIVNASTTVVTSTQNPSSNGDPVTFTATITPPDNGGNTVTFMDGNTTLGTVQTDIYGTGTAEFTTSSLTPGKHLIKAIFNGSLDLAPSTSLVLTQTVIQIAGLWIPDNNPVAINFDSSIGWNDGNSDNDVYLYGTNSLPNNLAFAVEPGSWNWSPDNPNLGCGFSTLAWNYADVSFSGGAPSAFGADANGNNSTADTLSWNEIQLVNNANHPELSSIALEFNANRYSTRDLTLRILNKTGAPASGWAIGLKAWIFGNYGTSTLTVQTSTDNVNYTNTTLVATAGDSATATNLTLLGALTTWDGSSVPANGYFYVRLHYDNNSSSGNGFVVDDLSLQANAPQPVYTPPVLSGGAMLSGGGFGVSFTGPSGQSYHVFTSTNLTLPVANWTPVASGTFDGNPVTYTNPAPTDPSRYYRIVSP